MINGTLEQIDPDGPSPSSLGRFGGGFSGQHTFKKRTTEAPLCVFVPPTTGNITEPYEVSRGGLRIPEFLEKRDWRLIVGATV